MSPRMESSSVLKRPSDSNSALFSVTPRDRLVYASGTVRSSASNNAPYIEWKSAGGREGTHRTHTYPDTRATRTAYMHGSSDETQRDVELGGAARINSHSPVARHIHGKLWILWQSAGKCVALMDQRKMSFGRATWLICFLLPKEDDHLWDEAGNGSRLAADKACLPVGQISIVPNWPSIQRCSMMPRNTHRKKKRKRNAQCKKKKKSLHGEAIWQSKEREQRLREMK